MIKGDRIAPERLARHLLPQGIEQQQEIPVGVGSGRPRGGEVRPEHERVRIGCAKLPQCPLHLEIDPAKTGRLDAHPLLGQGKQRREALLGQPQVVDADRGEPDQDLLQPGEVPGIDVELDMPAGKFEDPLGQGLQVLDFLRAAPFQVEADRPDPQAVQSQHLGVRDAGRQLGDSDKGRSQRGQGIDQVLLVQGLEGTGDHRAAGQLQVGGALQVVSAGEVFREVAVVGNQRKASVDDVEMAVENRDCG